MNQASDDEEINPLAILVDDIEERRPKANSEPQEHHHISSINSVLVIRQIPSEGLSFQLWPAASTLVSLFNDYRRQPEKSPLLGILSSVPSALHILELGSGTGLAGIAAAAILGAHVTLTDLPHVIPNLHFNAEANAELVAANGGHVAIQPLQWGLCEDVVSCGQFDILLASDVVYHDHLFEPLLDTLSWLILQVGCPGGFLMAHLRRWKKDAIFFNKARKLFHIKKIHTDSPSPGSRVGVAVYHFTSKDGFNKKVSSESSIC